MKFKIVRDYKCPSSPGGTYGLWDIIKDFNNPWHFCYGDTPIIWQEIYRLVNTKEIGKTSGEIKYL